ncbi:MAG: phage tail tip fiber protein, partial [Aeromonas veronii]
SKPSAINFVITVPETPTGCEVEAGNWSLAFRPQFVGGDGFGMLCEWWVSTINLPIGEVTEKARAGGFGAYMIFSQLKPDTTYYVWLRAVNAYGKSALLAVSAKTTYDPASILDIIDGEIGAEHLREELREQIEVIPDLKDGLTNLENVTDGLASTLSGVKSSYDASADAALEAATAGAEADKKSRKTIAQVTTEIKTQANELGALASKTDIISAQLDETVAAVQTTAEAVAKVDGEVRAGWYTKAQINGEGGGFGLSVQLAADGSVLSSFIVDADVFAVLSRASGVTSKRHPFVVKNGTVYMNHALMDTAEIANVIAQYINVKHLVGAMIEGSDIRGGTIYGTTMSAVTMNASNINGGNINIASRFMVDGNGAVTIRNSPGGVGMSINNNRIDVRDENGTVRVRVGYLW